MPVVETAYFTALLIYLALLLGILMFGLVRQGRWQREELGEFALYVIMLISLLFSIDSLIRVPAVPLNQFVWMAGSGLLGLGRARYLGLQSRHRKKNERAIT